MLVLSLQLMESRRNKHLNILKIAIYRMIQRIFISSFSDVNTITFLKEIK